MLVSKYAFKFNLYRYTEEEEKEEGRGGFAPAPGRQRLLAVLTRVAEENIERFAAAGYEEGEGRGGGGGGGGGDVSQNPRQNAASGGSGDAGVTGTEEAKEHKQGEETRESLLVRDGDAPIKEWMFSEQDSRTDPAVMTFSWWGRVQVECILSILVA
jgi:hypothetical protein